MNVVHNYKCVPTTCRRVKRGGTTYYFRRNAYDIRK